MHQKVIWVLVLFFSPFIANAAGVSSIDGSSLSAFWGLPFAGMILSIAIAPLIAPNIWEEHFGKIAALWAAAFLVPLVIVYGFNSGINVIASVLVDEYIPFILLLVVLFTASGGIHISGNLVGSPKLNVLILALGTFLASFMGTTGAAMLLIRPILKANSERSTRAHIPIFFIFLVANVGGGLTPLGDPPLFLGFLNGIDFFWTLKFMFFPVLITSSILLAIFYMVDSYFFKKEGHSKPDKKAAVTVIGKYNFLIILGVLLGIILSGIWRPNISWTIFETTIRLENICRDLLFIALTLTSLKITSNRVRKSNCFDWFPIIEVGKLFLAIFITIVPVIAILQAGKEGSFNFIVNITHDQNGAPINIIYFWVTTFLSAFLDNAPTYLVFFKMAAGDLEGMAAANYLMLDIPKTLLAISMGTVFTGPLTYIGNAPNFMVRTIAEQSGIKMPSFFSYMFIALVTFVPIYILLNFIFL